jgi:DNA-directed RNA polymerase specialized sigma24 family protein
VAAFPQTRVSLLLRMRSGDGPTRERAYDTLIASYWKPIYKYLRMRWRQGPEDAEDTTQAFLATAFEKQFFDRFDDRKARFRTFLRLCVDRYVQNQLKAAGRQKRGAGQRMLSLDFEHAEGELARYEPAVPPDHDLFFRQELTRELFARAVEVVRSACTGSGRDVPFRLFERYDLGGEEGLTYGMLATEFALPVTQVTNHLAAVRRQFRAAVLDQLRELTASDDEFREEARDLLGIEVATE